jgi:pyruvate dehydrogenase E1 component alpha subunit
LNLAAIWRAPLVVIVERNGWAYMTPSDSMLSVESISQRAASYAIEALTVDGNDVLAVYETAREALSKARQDRRPILVEAFSYRMHGHGAHDGQRYVPEKELASWRDRDPLLVWERRARTEAAWTDAEHEALETRVARETEEAVSVALAAPFPPAEGLLPSVFAA